MAQSPDGVLTRWQTFDLDTQEEISIEVLNSENNRYEFVVVANRVAKVRIDYQISLGDQVYEKSETIKEATESLQVEEFKSCLETSTDTASCFDENLGILLTCPDNFVAIEDTNDSNISPFCLAKYEMREDPDVVGAGKSISSGEPWQGIRPTEGLKA